MVRTAPCQQAVPAIAIVSRCRRGGQGGGSGHEHSQPWLRLRSKKRQHSRVKSNVTGKRRRTESCSALVGWQQRRLQTLHAGQWTQPVLGAMASPLGPGHQPTSTWPPAEQPCSAAAVRLMFRRILEWQDCVWWLGKRPGDVAAAGLALCESALLAAAVCGHRCNRDGSHLCQAVANSAARSKREILGFEDWNHMPTKACNIEGTGNR